jgi:hypothetical protein
MPTYFCNLCNYSTTKQYNNNKHLKTKKHLMRLEETTPQNAKKLQKSTISPQFGYFSPQNSTIYTISKKVANVCKYCNKEFSRSDSLKRHIKNTCKERESSTQNNSIVAIQEKMQLMEKEKEELKKHIEILLTKVGNNNITNNITNNIQLNSYGSEDLSHITKTLKTELLKLPFAMIPKLVEKVHFDPNKPENHNLMIVNKKESYVSIFKNGKWHYRDKNETLSDLVDGKYYILDEHYDSTNGTGLTQFQKQNYESFRNKFDDKDKELHKFMNQQCELTILNNRDSK